MHLFRFMANHTATDERIRVLKRLLAAEREMLQDPAYAIPTARAIAVARHELATLEARRHS